MGKKTEQEIRYPKGEDVCVTCCGTSGAPMFLITSKPMTGYYFLYEFTETGLTKLGKGQSPLELEERFQVKKRMGVL